MNTIRVPCFCTFHGGDYHEDTILHASKIVVEGHPGLRENFEILKIYPDADVDLCTLTVYILRREWRSISQCRKSTKRYQRGKFRVTIIRDVKADQDDDEQDATYTARMGWSYPKHYQEKMHMQQITWKTSP